MSSPVEHNLLNITTLKQLVQLQAKVPNLLKNQIDTFIQKWPLHREEIARALQSEQWQTAADVLHKARGHAGMIGLGGLSACCKVFEMNIRGDNPNAVDFEKELAAIQDCYEQSVVEFARVVPTLTPVAVPDAR